MNIRIAAPLLLVFASSIASAQWDVNRDFVLTDKEAVLMLPPEFVCSGEIKQIYWAPDGQLLLIERTVTDMSPAIILELVNTKQPPKSHSELLTYNLKTKKVKTLLQYGPEQGAIAMVQFIGKTSTVLVSAFTTPGQPVESFFMLSIDSGKVVPVAELSANQTGYAQVSPTKGIGVLTIFERDRIMAPPAAALPAGATSAAPAGVPAVAAPDTSIVQFFSADGRVDSPFQIPKRAFLEWGGTGETPFISEVVRDANRKVLRGADKKPVFQSYVVERATKKLTLTGAMTPFQPSSKASEFQVWMAPITNPTQKDSPKAPSVFMTWGQEKVPKGKLGVVTTDGRAGDLSPTEQAIAFESQNSVYVRQFARIDRSVYEQSVLAAARASIISDAKQCGLGIIMYTSDNDDKFPNNTDNIQNLINPYIKNSNILDGFVYTFGGGLATGIENPANTEIGYKPGPGGRAVVYADGHVKWRSDNP